jgi:predicted MPP superfamily phosphohydrolase
MSFRFHKLRYFISTYFWVAFIGAFLIIPVVYTYRNKMDGFMPKAIKTNWSLQTDPLLFVHFSDIHINHVVPENNEKFERAKNWALAVKPTWTVITGDLCDDFPGKKFPKYGYQQPKDWEIYNDLIKNFEKDVSFFDVAGNHDEFGVFEFDSDNHNFIKGRNITVDEFHVSKHVSNYHNGRKVHMIKLAPFKWPSAHPCFVFWPREDKHFLDLVEKSLEDVSEDDTVIFFCHYPLNLFENTKSSKGNTMKDLVHEPNSPRFFISGHLHPKKAYFQHQGKGFEAIAPALKATDNFGVFTLDHDRFVYQTVSNKDYEKFYITAPVPDEQLTPNTPFHEKLGYIRVRALTDTAPNISVSGAVEGDMECRKVNSEKETGYVCSLPYMVQNGKHSIAFHGDMEGRKLDFTIGIKSDDINEIEYDSSHWHFYYVILAIIWVLLVFCAIPFPIHPSFVDEHEMFLVGHMNEGSWWTTFFASFLLFKARVNKAPTWFKIVILIAVLYPICLPTSFIEIEGHQGFIFTYGYVCGGKYLYALWGQIHTLIYLGVTIYPVMIATCSLFVSKSFSPVFIVDAVICCFLFLLNIHVIIRNICESNGFIRAATAPCFVIIPIILWACVIYLLVKKLKERPYLNIRSQPLLSNV